MKKIIYTFFAAAMIGGVGCKEDAGSHAIEYPQTHRGTVADPYFGSKIEDPYRWMEYENSEDVKKWVISQNEITQKYLAALPQRAVFFSRLKEIWNYARFSPPFREGENYFFYKNDGLQNQSVLYKQKGLTGSPVAFLDPNTLSPDGTTSISSTAISHDASLFAYAISKAGSDWQEFHVRDIEKGTDLPDKLEWVKFSGAAWFGNGFFYTRYPEPKGNSKLSGINSHAKLYFHRIGKTQDKDSLAFEYPQDALAGVGASVSEDQSYLIVDVSKGATSKSAVYYKDLTNKQAPVLPLVANFENTYNFIENDGKTLLFLTDKDAPKKKVVRIDPKKPDPKYWRVIVPEQEGTLQGASLLQDKLFLTYMKDAQHQVKCYNLKGELLYDVALPGLGSVSGFGGHKNDSITFYTYTSFVQPPTIYKYNVHQNTSELYKKPAVNFPFEQYETKQVFYTSKDGTKVPMFLTHKKGIALTGNNPTYLYGYGGFDISVLPSFSPSILPFLEKGGIYAVANLRGGGEYGEEWHKGGMREKKQTVFDDFIAAAEYLIQTKYTSSQKLCISGRSNGGLLVGACMTQRPDLYKVALPAVGVMDMLRFHRFTIGHAWTTEYGCADSSLKQFETLYKYSPYHNIKKGVKYPATMVTTADHDDRVVPTHSYKFAAQLQYAQVGENPTLIRIETSAGHGSGKSTTKVIEEWADVWAFVCKNLEM